jgi:hypothetical protein
MLKNFKKEFNGDYGANSNKLKALCEVHWPAFGAPRRITRQNYG